MKMNPRFQWILFLVTIIFDSTNSLMNSDSVNSTPQQIHLSLGRKPTEIAVTWTTYNPKDGSYVKYGENEQNLDQITEGNVTEFVDGGSEKRKHFIHRVRLTGLKPFTKYYYQCGCKKSWSFVISFKTLSDDTQNWSPRMIAFGDLGLENGRSIQDIQREVMEDDNVNLIFHNGDIGYQLEDNNSRLGDEFMRAIEPFASKVPYQTSLGNHEYNYNFSNYVNRFTMYDMTDPRAEMHNHFYAFHIGPALILSISTEVYFFYEWYGKAQIYRQNEWLERTLKWANEPENRARYPWIIVFGHRPFYCTGNTTGDCDVQAMLLRETLEDVLFEYGVDLIMVGHTHNYERMLPIYQNEIYGSLPNMYHNPGAPVHILSGAAGMYGGLEDFMEFAKWSAFRQKEYGYSVITVQNSTHLMVEHKNTDGPMRGKIVDRMILIQEHHGMRTLKAMKKKYKFPWL